MVRCRHGVKPKLVGPVDARRARIIDNVVLRVEEQVGVGNPTAQTLTGVMVARAPLDPGGSLIKKASAMFSSGLG